MKTNTTSIILLIVSVYLLLCGMYALASVNTGTVTLHFPWPWLLGLLVGGTGLIVIARDLKK